MPNSTPAPDERHMEQLERDFPAASGMAFAKAYDQAIQAGLSVLVSKNGSIYEVFPDGRRELVKKSCSAYPHTARSEDQIPVKTSTPRLRMFAGPNGSANVTMLWQPGM